MNYIALSPVNLAIASGLVIALVIVNFMLDFRLTKTLIIATIRSVIQLSIIGYVITFVFKQNNLYWVIAYFILMLVTATSESSQRQKKRLRRFLGVAINSFAIGSSTLVVTLITLFFIIHNKPWYFPQYAIPLAGIVLGNAMNSVALSINNLNKNVSDQYMMINQRLALGQTYQQAISDLRREAMHTGMIPIINGMMAAGIVSLPGMMSGQLLAGVAPVHAAFYQILIMFMLAAGSGFANMIALSLYSKQLFDNRERLRLDRLN